MADREERLLVTGALGCLGAWVLKAVASEGAAVVAFDIAPGAPRLDLVLEPGERERIRLVAGDVTDASALRRALDEHGITRVIHLAALQIPFCRADPARGALVNVLGTVNVFEAVKVRRDRIPHVVYASSVAVFGAGASAEPTTHYGAYKRANEGTARAYWHDHGLPSIGLRPHTVYGVGRDQGLTSEPTKAMLAAALGRGHEIPYGGRSQFQYAPDVASAFVAAARARVEGALVHNLPGPAAHMREIVAAIEAAAPEAAGMIGFRDVALPFPADLDFAGLEAVIGPCPARELAAGVADTVERFRALARARRLAAHLPGP